MGELWDVYDINKNKTGKIAERGVTKLQNGEYHIAVEAVIINHKGDILISKRAAHKKYGLMWELNGGSILKGETSIEGMIRELKEELGITVFSEEAIFLKEVRRDNVSHCIKEIWLFRKDIEIEEITFPDGEAIEAKWVTINQFIDMFNKEEIVPNVDFGLEDYNKALKISEQSDGPFVQ